MFVRSFRISVVVGSLLLPFILIGSMENLGFGQGASFPFVDAKELLQDVNDRIAKASVLRWGASSHGIGEASSLLMPSRGVMTFQRDLSDKEMFGKIRYDVEVFYPDELRWRRLVYCFDGKDCMQRDVTRQKFIRASKEDAYSLFIPADRLLLPDLIQPQPLQFFIDKAEVKLEGASTLHGRDVYIVRCEIPEASGGGIARFFIDTLNHQLVRREFGRTIDGDYRGMIVDFKFFDLLEDVPEGSFSQEPGDDDVVSLYKQSEVEQLKMGEVAPAFQLTTSSGKELDSKDFQGKIVVLDFWASWCKPCLSAMPTLESLHQKYKGKGVTFVGVSMEPDDDLRELKKQLGVSFPLAEYQEQIGVDFKVSFLPTTVVIDQKGNVSLVEVGGSDTFEAIMTQKLDELLETKDPFKN